MMYTPLPEESPWGTIKNSTAIGLDVYAVTAIGENGFEYEGIMALKSAVGKTLSVKAASMGQDNGEWLCYGEDTKDIPVYEILQRHLAELKRNGAAVSRQLEEIRQHGRLLLTDYFGECAPPLEMPDGGASEMFYIRNGIYLAQNANGLKLAVHEAVAENYMTPMAAEYGIRKGEYLFYETSGTSGATCSVALYELKNVFREVAALIVSESSLYATLYQDFGEYVILYNRYVPEWERIPEENAVANMFLALQIEDTRPFGERQKIQIVFKDMIVGYRGKKDTFYQEQGKFEISKTEGVTYIGVNHPSASVLE